MAKKTGCFTYLFIIFLVCVAGTIFISRIFKPPKNPESAKSTVPSQKLISYKILSKKDVSIAGCTRMVESILVPSGTENNITAIRQLITKILNNKNRFCEYSVYVLIEGKEDIPIIYGKYVREKDSIAFHSNESTFYGMYPRNK